MRELAVVLVTVCACGGGSKGPEGPAPTLAAMPIVGLEGAGLGDSVDEVMAAFPLAQVEGDDLWLEEATVEQRPASVGFRFEGGGLRTATVSFGPICDDAEKLGAILDRRLGKRTSAEPGIAAWSRGGWDVALYCHVDDRMIWLRLDVRPSPTF
jgi:hypothetical protein